LLLFLLGILFNLKKKVKFFLIKKKRWAFTKLFFTDSFYFVVATRPDDYTKDEKNDEFENNSLEIVSDDDVEKNLSNINENTLENISDDDGDNKKI
jgi:hypothetical protein